MEQEMLFGDAVVKVEEQVSASIANEAVQVADLEACYQFAAKGNGQALCQYVGEQDRQCKERATQKEKANRSNLTALLEHQEYRCAACAIDLSPSTAQLDHVKPRADGGTDYIDNLQWLCATCNKAKGTMGMGSFVSMCQRVAHKFSLGSS